MRATKLLLILAFRFGVTEMSGQEFFNRALKAGVSAYSLDPIKMGFNYVINATLATVNMYQVTATGLATVHRRGENFIWVNNSGTSLEDQDSSAECHDRCSSKCYCRNNFYNDNENRSPCKHTPSSTGHQREKCGIKSGRFQDNGSRNCGSEVDKYRRLYLGLCGFATSHRNERQEFP
uniref:Putative secreted protein n=1 Tax=Ixodes ricinus TaxID=34613 RepID=A0A090XB57_IXORI